MNNQKVSVERFFRVSRIDDRRYFHLVGTVDEPLPWLQGAHDEIGHILG